MYTDDYGTRIEYLPSKFVRLNNELSRRWHLEHYAGSNTLELDHEYVWFLHWSVQKMEKETTPPIEVEEQQTTLKRWWYNFCEFVSLVVNYLFCP